MNRVGKFFESDPIRGGVSPAKKVLTGFAVAALGFVLSSVNISGGVSPFGFAFVPCGGVPGLLGVLWGIWLNGEDVFRYLSASVINFVSFGYLKRNLDLPQGVIAFLCSMWSVIISGLMGLFTVKTTFAENCMFALSGVVAGVFSYAFTVYSDTLRRRKNSEISPNTEYVCSLATVAAVIVSFSSFGKVWASGSAVLAFVCVFAVSMSGGFFRSLVFSSVIGFSLVLADGENTVILAALMFGSLLSAIVSPLGKYAVFTSYAISGIIICVYFRADELPYSRIFNIVAAGVIFLMLPKSVYTAMTEILLPKRYRPGGKAKRKKLKNNSRIRVNMGDRHICKTCAACSDRFICWVRDYGYTSEVFEDFRRSVREGEAAFPSHFLSKCRRTETLSDELCDGILNKTGFEVDYTKCSEPKVGQKVCGDSCCVFVSGEKQIICIADGMGSGPEASRESRKSSRLMKDLMSKGVSKEDAVRVLNETLIKSEYETVLALDIAVFDLKTGVCEFVKAGAAPSYVIRNGSLYELGSRSVPVGVLDELSLEYDRSSLLGGDVLIMVSDGMVSDGGEWIGVLLKDLSELEMQSPLLLAENIMSGAKRLGKNADDDITVIVSKIRAVRK